MGFSRLLPIATVATIAFAASSIATADVPKPSTGQGTTWIQHRNIGGGWLEVYRCHQMLEGEAECIGTGTRVLRNAEY
jgi:hypothetical protein